jgi:L-alanine-DL-glutamate epimerase-like enolase superfamily enzyme
MPAGSLPTEVREVRVAPLDIPLRAPFGISRGAQESAANALVRVELADGTVGHGEAAPFPDYNGETQAAALAALAAAGRWARGRDASDWKGLGAELRSRPGGCGSGACALETALLDALCRREGTPLWRRFGGAGTELETDMTVTLGTGAEAREAARGIRARGFRVIKVKVGAAGGAREDVARVCAVAEEAPGSPLILDGNAGLTRAGAARLAAGLRACGVVPALAEQWLARDDVDGMRSLREETGWPQAADEGVASAADARRLADARAADVFNVKLMKAGVAEALEVVEVARRAGVGLMIGGNVESVLAMTASACLAAGLGGFAYADLDTPLFLARNPFEGGYRLEGGRISLGHIAAGHGVAPAGLLL